mmetsp:Transcript_38612/g.111003  ORF Transcript_38612/g.111003 Transcript_38612/m.111003 type:complete len:270 (-) Transcript_38612:102-911(-)
MSAAPAAPPACDAERLANQAQPVGEALSAPQQVSMAPAAGLTDTAAKSDTPLAELEFMDFAPAPCSCCSFLVPDVARSQLFARIYDDRIEANLPAVPLMCLTSSEDCVIEVPVTTQMDRAPHRVGMFCCCIPCYWCGPPVLYEEKPHCLCANLEPWCGTEIRSAPASFFGLQLCLCCGRPCYTCCSVPVFRGTQNAEIFLAKWREALLLYASRPELAGRIALDEMAIMESVEGSIFNLNSAGTIQAKQSRNRFEDEYQAKYIVKSGMME